MLSERPAEPVSRAVYLEPESVSIQLKNKNQNPENLKNRTDPFTELFISNRTRKSSRQIGSLQNIAIQLLNQFHNQHSVLRQ